MMGDQSAVILGISTCILQESNKNYFDKQRVYSHFHSYSCFNSKRFDMIDEISHTFVLCIIQ